jgi:hypothetical protein
VVVALALLFTAATSSAGHWSRAKDPTGAWFVEVPGGLTAFYTFHRHGTLSGASSVMFGGPPQPQVATHSSDHGIWARAKGRIHGVVYRYGFDPDSGDVVGFIRIRMDFRIDKGCKTASGVFFIAQWTCPLPTECPDPNTTDPDFPEFAPPDNTFTMTRVRIP